MGKMYLWSPVSDGGETTTVRTPNGGDRNVVVKRNVLPVGKEVTQASFDNCTDEQWQEWIDGGVVREYPYPEMPAGSSDSPVVFLQKKLAVAAQSEEERLVAAVTGSTSTEAGLVEAAGNVKEPAPEKTEEKK